MLSSVPLSIWIPAIALPVTPAPVSPLLIVIILSSTSKVAVLKVVVSP